ncbi:hypothetical protein V1278_000171 [Bradyrhizobium sp. AZCC 1577]
MNAMAKPHPNRDDSRPKPELQLLHKIPGAIEALGSLRHRGTLRQNAHSCLRTASRARVSSREGDWLLRW